jgi:hypothetical protein
MTRCVSWDTESGMKLFARERSRSCSSASVITSLRDDELTERAMVTKIIFSRSGHRPKTVLLWKQEPTRQGGLHDGPAWPCIGALPRASAASHRQLISARRRDELGSKP